MRIEIGSYSPTSLTFIPETQAEHFQVTALVQQLQGKVDLVEHTDKHGVKTQSITLEMRHPNE